MAVILQAEVLQALALLAIHALDPHRMPFTGTQRTHQVAQAVVLAAVADYPRHRRRTTCRALPQAVAGLEFDAGHGQQPMAPRRLQRGPQKRHQRRRHRAVLPAQQCQRPHHALPCPGLAQLRLGLMRQRRRRLVALQQGIQPALPGALAHQAVGGQGRQAVGHAQLQALRVGHGRCRWVVQQPLLHAAQPGHEAQVVAQRMPLGQQVEAFGTQRKQLGRWRVQKRRRTGRSLDLIGFHHGTQGLAPLCVSGRSSRVTSRYHSAWCLRAHARLTQPCSMALTEPLIQMPA